MDRREPDRSYFERRALEEVDAAGRSRSEAVRRVHEDLARRYRQAALDRSIPADEPIGGNPAAGARPGMMPLLSPDFRILN